jgi:hypothetical protein
MVRDMVDSLVAAEMRTFTPAKGSYLSHLPYPQLKFSNSPALQVVYRKNIIK